MKKEDINVGDRVVVKQWTSGLYPARPVLVMSLEPHATCRITGNSVRAAFNVYGPTVLVTVLDLGVRTIVPVDWLEPTDGMDGSNLENWDVAAKKKREER